MFSAYDLKKIIPRAIFALVLVNLSWGLMEIFIRAVDVIGKGAEELVMAPFGDIGRGIEIGASSGAAVFTLTAVGAAGAAFGLIPILGVAITGLFGILFAFVITLIRRVLLIGLVIIAPVAIALSVFPQTESWAKKWWDWFSKLLLMYPFIMAFFGLSKVSAGIISKARGTDVATDIMYDLAAIALLILPYFLVGKALSLAGGAIGKVAGMVNNKDKGVIDWAKKKEAAKVAERRSDSRGAGRFDNGTLRGKVFNRPLRRAMNPGSLKPWASDAERRASLMSGYDSAVKQHEELHPGAKDLSGEEAEILVRSMGSRIHARRAVEEKADDARTAAVQILLASNPAASASERLRVGERAAEQERTRWQEIQAMAEQKAGGLDVVASAHAMTKAAESGNLTPIEIERFSSAIGHAVGGNSSSAEGTTSKVMASALKAAGEKGHLVTSHGGEGRSVHDSALRAVQRSTNQQLGTQSQTSGEQMTTALVTEIQNSHASMQNAIATGNIAAAEGHAQTLIRAHGQLETIRTAAATHGNERLQQTVAGASTQLQGLVDQAQIQATAAGLTNPDGTTPINIQAQSLEESRRRTGATLQP